MNQYLKTNLSRTEFYNFGKFKISKKKLKQSDWFIVEPQTIEFEILYYNEPQNQQQEMSNDIYNYIFDEAEIEYNFVKQFTVYYYRNDVCIFVGVVDKSECKIDRGQKIANIKAYDVNVFFSLIKNNRNTIDDYQLTFPEVINEYQTIVRNFGILADSLFVANNNTSFSLPASLQGKNIEIPFDSINPGSWQGMGVAGTPQGYYETRISIYKPWEYEDINGNSIFGNNIDNSIFYIEFRQYYCNADQVNIYGTFNYEKEELTVIKISDFEFEIIDHEKRQVFFDNAVSVIMSNGFFGNETFSLTPSTDYLLSPYIDQVYLSFIPDKIFFETGVQYYYISGVLGNQYRINFPAIGENNWSITPASMMRKEICIGDYFQNHTPYLSNSLLSDVLKRFLIQFNIIMYVNNVGGINFIDYGNYTNAVIIPDEDIISVIENYDNIDELTDLPASSGNISSLLELLNKTVYKPILKNNKIFEIELIANQNFDVGSRIINSTYDFDIFVLELGLDIDKNLYKVKGIIYG